MSSTLNIYRSNITPETSDMIVKYWQIILLQNEYFYFWYFLAHFADNTYVNKVLNAGFLFVVEYFYVVLLVLLL